MIIDQCSATHRSTLSPSFANAHSCASMPACTDCQRIQLLTPHMPHPNGPDSHKRASHTHALSCMLVTPVAAPNPRTSARTLPALDKTVLLNTLHCMLTLNWSFTVCMSLVPYLLFVFKPSMLCAPPATSRSLPAPTSA